MKKKIVSVLLALVLCTSLLTLAYSVESVSNDSLVDPNLTRNRLWPLSQFCCRCSCLVSAVQPLVWQ